MSAAAYCGACGWPVTGPACEACGTASTTAPPKGEDHLDLSLLGGARPEDYPDLKNAFLGWKQKDWPRMIGQCLVALGVDAPRITNLPDGPGWSFFQDSAAIYLSLDKTRGIVAIESPIVMLPLRQRVPLMRTLLELNEQALGAARFCLRGELVLLRFTDRAANLAPPKLVNAIRELALSADQFDDLLSLKFAARMMGPEAEKQRLDWSLLGTPCKLKLIQAARSVAPAEPAPPAAISAPETQLAQAEALCELLRSSLDLARPFQFMEVHEAVPLLLQRALVFRAYDEHRQTCPDAIAVLLRHGERIYAQLWETPAGWKAMVGNAMASSALPSAAALQTIVGQIVQARGLVGPQPGPQPATSPVPFSSSTDAKTVMRKYLAEIEKGPTGLAHRHFLLLGAYAELMARTRMPEATVARVRQIMDEGRRLGATAEGLAFLTERLKGIVA